MREAAIRGGRECAAMVCHGPVLGRFGILRALRYILDEGNRVMREHCTADRPGLLGRVAQLQGKHWRVTMRVGGHDKQDYEPETHARLSKSGEIISVTP
jgi:hypothetical protein